MEVLGKKKSILISKNLYNLPNLNEIGDGTFSSFIKLKCHHQFHVFNNSKIKEIKGEWSYYRV